MSDAFLLSADRISKLYARRTQSRRARLAQIVWPALLGLQAKELGELRDHEFWAVDDVSFGLRKGEAVGVIGLNGSGKTTLLRMLAGQILPDKGEIMISGSSAAMIDLQAGFQPTASGRQNIFLRSAALGFSRERTLQRLDEIIDFSELGDAIDAPMASYSSGMKMRLAFSVMATVAPDVLFIDEVLGVGDFRFRQKCLGKIREMRERSAFVFVSHSMGDIERFCDRVIVLHKGRQIFMGPPREAIEIYESIEEPQIKPDKMRLIKAMGPVYSNENAVDNVEHFWCDADGRRVETVKFGESVHLYVSFRSSVDFRNIAIGVPIWNHNAHYSTGLSTQVTSNAFDVRAGETVQFIVDVAPGILNPGVIKSMLGIVDGVEFMYRKPNPDLQIVGAPHPTWGAVTIPHKWRRIGQSAPASKQAAGEAQ